MTPRWEGRRRAEALAFVKRKGRANNEPCVICLLPIDYDLEWPDVLSCTVQHLRSRQVFPHLTWVRSNWAPAHLSCNAGHRDERAGLGLMS